MKSFLIFFLSRLLYLVPGKKKIEVGLGGSTGKVMFQPPHPGMVVSFREQESNTFGGNGRGVNGGWRVVNYSR